MMSVEQLPNGSFAASTSSDVEYILPVRVQLPVPQRRLLELPAANSSEISPEDAAAFAATNYGITIEDIDDMTDEQLRRFLRRGSQESSSRPAAATKAGIAASVETAQPHHGRHELDAVAPDRPAGMEPHHFKHAAVEAVGDSADKPGESPEQPTSPSANEAKPSLRHTVGQKAAAVALAATGVFQGFRAKAGKFIGKANAKVSNGVIATQEYFGDKDKGERRKWVAAGVGALAVVTAVALYAATRGSSNPTETLGGQTPGAPTGPPLHPSEAVPSTTVSPPVETPVPGPSGGAPSPESVVPPAAPPAEAVQGLHFNGNAGTAWQSMSEAGIPPSDIMTKLENALNASGVDFVKHVDALDGTDTWFEIIYPDGSRASDTASIMAVAGPYITL